jgi:hypothetical protein
LRSARSSVDGRFGAAVDGEVGLAIAVEVQAAERDTPHRLLEDPRREIAALPARRSRETDVHRDDTHDVDRPGRAFPEPFADLS